MARTNIKGCCRRRIIDGNSLCRWGVTDILFGRPGQGRAAKAPVTWPRRAMNAFPGRRSRGSPDRVGHVPGQPEGRRRRQLSLRRRMWRVFAWVIPFRPVVAGPSPRPYGEGLGWARAVGPNGHGLAASPPPTPASAGRRRRRTTCRRRTFGGRRDDRFQGMTVPGGSSAPAERTWGVTRPQVDLAPLSLLQLGRVLGSG